MLVSRVLHRSKDLAFLPPLDMVWRNAFKGKITCLVYHRVYDKKNVGDFLDYAGVPAVSKNQLREDISLLKKANVQFITFQDIREKHIDEAVRSVIICFDDCYRDTYVNGLDVLGEQKIRATFFQTAGMVESKELIWEHVIGACLNDEKTTTQIRNLIKKKLNVESKDIKDSELVWSIKQALNVEEISKLIIEIKRNTKVFDKFTEFVNNYYPAKRHIALAESQGHEIGSHGYKHYSRFALNAEQFEEELSLSKKYLSKICLQPPQVFSFPYGDWNKGDSAMIRQYYAQAATVESIPFDLNTDQYCLPRFTWPGENRNIMKRRRWLWLGEH